jgi:hypothetical protein
MAGLPGLARQIWTAPSDAAMKVIVSQVRQSPGDNL